jgi:hypothetical protein
MPVASVTFHLIMGELNFNTFELSSTAALKGVEVE